MSVTVKVHTVYDEQVASLIAELESRATDLEESAESAGAAEAPRAAAQRASAARLRTVITQLEEGLLPRIETTPAHAL